MWLVIIPGGSGGKSVCLQCGKPRFNLWVRKIPWRRKWQLTPVLLPGKITWTEEPGRLQSMGSQSVGHTKQLHFHFHFFLPTRIYIWEKAMAPHSSTLAWKIPWTEEPGRLQSMGSLRVGHDWATSLSLFPFLHWRRKWQPTPVFLPGESQGRGSLVGCRLWGRTELDTTEAT